MSDEPGDDTPDQAEAEFDTMASWTADVVRALGPEYALPAGCRGSGSPAALRWLGEQLGLAPGRLLLDVGAGVGGPAAFARAEFGVETVLFDPMTGACQAAHSMFGATSVIAPAEQLPLHDAASDAIWSLGVLCSVDDLDVAMRELSRALSSDGRLGMLVYLRTVPNLTDEPAGNHFPSLDELDRVVAGAGLITTSSTEIDTLPAAPEGWQTRADEVDQWIKREHGNQPAWRAGSESEQSVGHLIDTGQIVGHLRTLRRA